MEKWRDLTYEKLMELFAETDRRAAERVAEADRCAAERAAEADKRAAEFDRRMAKLDEKMDKTYKTIVGVSDNSGAHAEQYFQNALAKSKFFGGEKYDKIIKNLKFEGKESCEFDIFLVNGKSVAIIEAKHRIHHDFVEELATEKTAQFRKNFPEYKNYKLRLGIAGFSFSDKVIESAKKHGIGIIRQVGDSIEIDDNKLKVY